MPRLADTMRGVVALGAGSGCLKPAGGCPRPASAGCAAGAADCAVEASAPPLRGSLPSDPPLLPPSRRLGISTERRRPLPEDGVGDVDPYMSN